MLSYGVVPSIYPPFIYFYFRPIWAHETTVYDFAYPDTEPLVEKILPSSGPLNVPPMDRNWWLNEIEDEKLLRKLMVLSDSDIELLTAIVMEGRTQSEFASAKGTNQQSVSRQFQQIRKIFDKPV